MGTSKLLRITETGDKRRPDGRSGSPNYDWGQTLPYLGNIF